MAFKVSVALFLFFSLTNSFFLTKRKKNNGCPHILKVGNVDGQTDIGTFSSDTNHH